MARERAANDGEWGTLVGHVVNGHEVLELLGAGGMGEVYLARHQFLGTYRALKVIHDGFRQNSEAEKRFHREAVALGRLEHPNVVKIVDFGRLPNEWLFMLMEYLEGPTIDDQIMARGPMPLADGLHVLLQLARALAYAHQQDIVHRDLKPANAIFHRGDIHQLKVIDFGLVHLVSDEMRTKLTKAQQVMGSPDYMAPEQAQGRLDISPATDVYALGGIAHRLLTGHTPFGERPLVYLIAAHSAEEPPRLANRCASPLPPGIGELVDACLAKDPAARPDSSDFAAHVATALAALDAPAAPVSAGGAGGLHKTQSLSAVEPPASPEGPTAPAPPADHVGSAGGSRPAAAFAAVQPVRDVAPAPAASEALRGATKVAVPPAPPPDPARTTATALKHLLDEASAADPTSVRGPLATQIGAVIGELASELSGSGDIAHRQQEAERLRGELTQIEMDIALLDADLLTSSSPDLLAKRRAAEETRRGVRVDLHAHELMLIERVERARAGAGEALAPLYAELDQLIGRLRRASDG